MKEINIEEFIGKIREVCADDTHSQPIILNPSETHISYNKNGEIDHIWLHGNRFFKIMGDTNKCISYRVSYEKNHKTKEFTLIFYRWFDSKGWVKLKTEYYDFMEKYRPKKLF